jgi:hypothetical protein
MQEAAEARRKLGAYEVARPAGVTPSPNPFADNAIAAAALAKQAADAVRDAKPVVEQISTSAWQRDGLRFSRKETNAVGLFYIFAHFDEVFCAWRAEVLLDGRVIFMAHVGDRLTALDTCDAAVDEFVKLVPR